MQPSDAFHDVFDMEKGKEEKPRNDKEKTGKIERREKRENERHN